MNCAFCGSQDVQPNGYCANCGHPVALPTAQYSPPAVEFATAQPQNPPLTANSHPAAYPPPAGYATPTGFPPPTGYAPPAGYATPTGYAPPAGYGPPPQQYGAPAPYGQPPMLPYQGQFPGYPTPPQTPNVLSIIAFVLAGIAVIFSPILFGLGGLICARFADRRGEQLAKVAYKVSAICLFAGLGLRFLLAAIL